MQMVSPDGFRQFVRLGLLMVPLALALYWADEWFFAPGRLPACVQENVPEGHLCPDMLLTLPPSATVVWIDARSESDFDVRHLELKGNDMFPVRPGEQKQELLDRAVARLTELGPEDRVVVFCSGGCSSSEEIAADLRELGLEAPVYVLEGGWEALKNRPDLLRE